MAKIACITLPAAGHINPMAALARELVARGHEVVFFHISDAENMITRLGQNFETVGTHTHPLGWLSPVKVNAGLASTWRGSLDLLRDAASLTDMLCRELPTRLRLFGADMILADQNEAAGGMVAYRLGLPFVTIAAALPLNWEPDIPVPFVGWGTGSTRWHRYRNIISMKAARIAFSPLGDAIESIAAEWRIKPGRLPDDYMSGFAQIAQLTPSLDFPRKALIKCFHYCGPLRTPKSGPARDAPIFQNAFASLGTLQGHRASLFEKIALAAKRCELDLLIAHGGGLSALDVSKLSHLAIVRDFVEQEDVLLSSKIAILHGGLNTVLDALASGVPIVAVPLAFEQGAIAARITFSGVGLSCGPMYRSTHHIAKTIQKVLANPAYIRAARSIGEEITRSGGVTRAADIVEAVERTGRPALRVN